MSHPTPDTIALFGLPIANVSAAETMAHIEACLGSGQTHQIASASLGFARNALNNEYLRRILCECSMVLPEGTPMLWASSLLGARLRKRTTGPGLIPLLARLSADRGLGIFLLGSDEAGSRGAAEALKKMHPGVRVVGRCCPSPASLHAMNNEAILRQIEAVAPHILLVDLGDPKQEIWIHRHRDRLRVPVAMGVSGAFRRLAGSAGRAPRWVDRMHLGWAFRTASDPRRRIPQHVRDMTALLRHLPLLLAAFRLQPVERRRGRLQVSSHGSIRVLAMPALLRGKVIAAFLGEIRGAAAEGQTVVLDLSGTLRIEADGLGALLEARRILLEEGLWIWLSAVALPVRRVLQFSAVADLFRIVDTPVDAIQFSTSLSHGRRQGSKIRPMSPTQVAKAS